jgi:predicted transcriptional regulator
MTISPLTHAHVVRVADLVSAYVSRNAVPPGDLAGVVTAMHRALAALPGQPLPAPAPDIDRPSAHAIRQSVQPAGLVSFLDGKSYKTLKRHLSKHGLDPESYRERFGLPADYPMVAAQYAERRSSLAKQLGFGRVISGR